MKKTVLVVDDDGAIREVVHTLLELHGYEVVEAVDGQDAFEKLADCSPAIILLDLMMPNMDGIDFARELHKRRMAFRLVAFSACGTARSFAEQIGAIGYLEKPFHLSQLLNALPQWMLPSSSSSSSLSVET